MTPKRPRIADKDPLNRTERVLQNFTPDDEPTGQPESPAVEMTSEQADKSEAGTATEEVNTLTSQEVSKPTSQHDDLITSQTNDKIASQPDNPITRQVNDKPARQPDDKPTRQPEEPQPVELKKATFQIDKAVLARLEKFVLNLQLELGKENAPYKEVIVEEAIDCLIVLDKTKLLKALEKRQGRRKG